MEQNEILFHLTYTGVEVQENDNLNQNLHYQIM